MFGRARVTLARALVFVTVAAHVQLWGAAGGRGGSAQRRGRRRLNTSTACECRQQQPVQLVMVADKGSSDRCGGEDWLAIQNTGGAAVNITGYKLSDSKGLADEDAFTFPAGATIAGGETMVLCRKSEGSFAFGIGGDDTVALHSPADAVLDTTQLADDGGLDRVWTRGTGGVWAYAVHTMTAPPSTKAAAVSTAAGIAVSVDGSSPVQLVMVADKGSSDRCGGEDWLAIQNTGGAAVNVTGYKLSDSKGLADEDAFTFPAGATIAGGEILVLCRKSEGSFAFGIGADDTVSLHSPADAVLDTTQLADDGGLDRVWTRGTAGVWAYAVYTTTAPPGTDAAAATTPAQSAGADSSSPLQLVMVADKGSSDRCGGEDWLAIQNTGGTAENITGYKLSDAKGLADEDAFTFPAGAEITGGEILVLCRKAVGSFAFGIGGDDMLTLHSPGDAVLDSTQLADDGGLDRVWTRGAAGVWAYAVHTGTTAAPADQA